MKVLIVPPEDFLPSKNSISSIFQFHQACALLKAGVEVLVVSVERPMAIKSLTINLIRRLIGSQVHYAPIMQLGAYGIFRLLLRTLVRRPKIKYEKLEGLHLARVWLPCWSDLRTELVLKYYADCIWKGYRMLERDYGRPDIIHAHNAWLSGTSVMQIHEQENIPYCITEHSSFFARGIIPSGFYNLVRKVYERSSFNFMVSHSLGEFLSSRGLLPGGYDHLPNILDPIFMEASASRQRREGPITFLNVASLIDVKGQEDLIRAFHMAYGGDSNARLLIAGEGELRGKLTELIRVLGLTGQVKLLGLVGRKPLLSLMEECNVFVFPSKLETFGVVVIEAHAVGRPVIATRSGGPNDIILESNGLLVPVGDVEALSAAMREMATNLDRYDPETIRHTALSRYSSKSFAIRAISVYEEAIRENVVI
ncbi:MAG: glycosyltransferase family 4 protein [Chitinophagia bacterium]|nr:glycosyltransferase family 4 protein [Chitinophagia bacterium]